MNKQVLRSNFLELEISIFLDLHLSGGCENFPIKRKNHEKTLSENGLLLLLYENDILLLLRLFLNC